MAKLTKATLSATGSRADAKMIIEGTIQWDGQDRDLNSLELHVHFWGEDGGLRGADDDLLESKYLISRSQDGFHDGSGYRASYKTSGSETEVRVVISNTVEGGHRRFDEDMGKDEVYAHVFLKEMGRDVFHGKQLRTETVEGDF